MVAGLVPLGLGAVLLIRASDQSARRYQGARMSSVASGEARMLTSYFARQRALLLVGAGSPVWRGVFTAPGSLDRTIAEGGTPIHNIDVALRSLQAADGGSVDEACFIAPNGQEIARLYRGEPTPRANLAADERSNSFVRPTLGLPNGEVYQVPPYISPDSHQWVIAAATPVPVRGFERGILHFEVPIEALREVARQEAAGLHVSVVDARTGSVVFDTSRRQRIGAPLGRPGSPRVSTAGIAGRDRGMVEAYGKRVAFQRVAHVTGSANEWYVVVDATPPGVLRPTKAAQAVLALMVLALMGLGLALGRQSAAVRRGAEQTAHQAMHDELTGLPNRLLFRDRTEHAIGAAHRDGIQTAVMLMDVDRFREINDTLGHHAGDRVIAAVAARLRGALRSSDTLARLGGDEFAVLMPRIMEESAAVQLAARIRDRARGSPHPPRRSARHRGEHRRRRLPGRTAATSTPCSSAPRSRCTSPRTPAPRSRSTTRPPTSTRPSGSRSSASCATRSTAASSSCTTSRRSTMVDGRVRSVEALVRWQHPERGLLGRRTSSSRSPSTRASSGRSPTTSSHRAEQCRQWRDRGIDLPVAVNLSARDLVDLDLAAAIAAELDRFGLEPALASRLEITETMLVADPNRRSRCSPGSTSMGVRVSLDDFGTGYSSLSYLQRLPGRRAQDRPLVRHATWPRATPTRHRPARSSTSPAPRPDAVAEGVETAETWDQLVRLGCDVAQGYFISRPLPAAELEVWLAGVERHAAMSEHPEG